MTCCSLSAPKCVGSVPSGTPPNQQKHRDFAEFIFIVRCSPQQLYQVSRDASSGCATDLLWLSAYVWMYGKVSDCAWKGMDMSPGIREVAQTQK